MEFDNKILHDSLDNHEEINVELNLRDVFEKFTYHWKWILIGLIFSLSIAFVSLRYSQKQYNVSTVIFIDDKESGGVNSEFSALEGLGILSGGAKTTIVNETGVLKSLTLMKNVVKSLGLNITYFEEGKIQTSELYGDKIPIKLNIFASESLLFNLDTILVINILSQTKYVFKNDKDVRIKEMEFGKNIRTGFGEINITTSKTEDIRIGKTIIIKITPLITVANNYRNKLLIEPESIKSSLLILSLTDAVKDKAEDILNYLITQYNKDAIAYKTLITENTDKFINDRIEDISLDLGLIDSGVEEFKTKNKLTDLEYEAGLVLSLNSNLQKEIYDLNSQIKVVDYIIDHLKNNKEDLIPANLGIGDNATNANTAMFNQLMLEKKRIIKGSSSLNPTVINLDAQLVTLRQSIEQGLVNLRSSLVFSINEAKAQEYQLSKKKEIAPKQEREFQDIRRQQQIVESLYLYLLQKREENAILLGIPVPIAKIIDKAYGSDAPVSPKPIIVYLIAGVLGLLFPIIILSIGSLLDNKIHSYEDVKAIVKAPIIGVIPRTNIKKKVIISNQESSGIAESFRLLRTNVNFMLSGAKEKAKTIFVTSTLSAEGKTFIAINLASSIALLNKRVLLIGADIRKPKITSYLNIKPENGLTHLLVDNNLRISDVIVHDEENNIDILVAGEIPPNPSELLLNGRFETILSSVKEHYDYIIIDTAPVNMVTDTLLISQHADLFIYIIRAEYLDKRMLKVPQMMYTDRRLPNMAVLINAADFDKNNYGYGYGYGKYDSKTSWWKKSKK